MNALVKFIGNDVFTDSMIIADGTGNEHNSVTRIIRNYKEDFEDFGNIRFVDLKSKNPLGGRPTRVYQLNEPQATLLVTYLDNSAIVRKFKKELVRQFYEMRRLLIERQSPHWQATRLESKKNRRMETDEIKMLVEYAKAQGSKNADKYYISFSKLANKAVGIQADSRDALSSSAYSWDAASLPVITMCTSAGARLRGQIRPFSSWLPSAIAASARVTPTP